MKKYIILLICLSQLSFLHPAFGQMPTNGDYSNWNWENQDQDNWRMNNRNLWIPISPPFGSDNQQSPNYLESMKDVIDKKDYTKSKGWRLVRASFSPNVYYPYFILYNKYRAIIRVFFYIGDNEPFHHAVVTCSFSETSPKPAILSSEALLKVAADKYLAKSYDGNDIIVRVIKKAPAGQWASADFPVLFDPHITDANYIGASMEINLYGCDNYDIKLAGTATSSTDPELLNQDHTFVGKKSDVLQLNIEKISAFKTSLIKKINSTDEAGKDISKAIRKIDSTDYKFLQNLKKWYVQAEDIKKADKIWTAIFKSSKIISPAVGVVLDLFSAFAGQEGTAHPVITYQSLELKGTMNIQKSLAGFTIKVPGVLKNANDEFSYLYDCPLGIFNLKTTPKIQVTEPYVKIPNFEIPKLYQKSGYPTDFCSNLDEWGYIIKSPSPYVMLVKYKLEQDIDLIINQVPGMQLLDMKFAILCKPKGYKITDPYLFIQHPSFIIYLKNDARRPEFSAKEHRENPVYNALLSGRLIVHKYDDEVIFGSPYMDKSCLKGFTFEVPERTELIGLGVYALFKVDGMDDPVVFHYKYAMEKSNPVPVAQKTVECDPNEQPTFPYADYYNYPVLSINLAKAGDKGTYITESIVMEPGFSAVAGFTAKGERATKCLGSAAIKTENYNCGSNLRIASLKEAETTASNEESELTIYPNPTSDKLYITSSQEIIYVQATDIVGQTASISFTQSGNKTEVDCSKLKPGIYLLTISTPQGSRVRKIVRH